MFPEFELKEGWATIILLLLILLCVALSIQHAEWTEGLAILQGIVLLGGGLGIVLAKSRTPNRMAHLLSGLSGVAWAAFLTSRVLAGSAELSTQAAVVELDYRLQKWLFVLINRQSSGDNMVFLFLLSLLLWIMAYFSAWAVFRWQRVWWAVIVCGVALMVNTTYAPVSISGYLIVFLLFSLLLVVRANIAFYEQEWRVARIAYSSELVLSFLRAGLTISLLAILLAWATPKALASRPLEQVWDKLAEPWRRIQDQSARVFQDLNYRNEPNYIYSDRSMRFGGPVNLPDTPVFDAQASKGRYWRVMVFHEYTGVGWNNTDSDTILINQNEQILAVPEFELREEFTQTITLQQDLGPEGMVVAGGQPLRTSVPIRAVVSLVVLEQDMIQDRKVSPSFATPGDPSVIYSREALKAGQSYQVYSSFSMADAQSLREAGTDYPAWVIPRYLQLPTSLPARVRILAEQIAADELTPYDKAVAIERYLRQIPYNQDVPGPGLTQDGVDYFLFEEKQGYCDYFASAMVVMLRAVDVPARFVRGYSQGEETDGVYHILKSDGHAWPEVFFPGYGWVEFEPTSGQPALVRPRSQDTTSDPAIPQRQQPIMDDEFNRSIQPDAPLDAPGAPELNAQPVWQRIGRVGWFALDMTALGLVLVALFRERRRRQIEGLTVAERVYMDLGDWVRRLLRIDQLAHQTPHEYVGFVERHVPCSRGAMQQIADSYVAERFGGKQAPPEPVELAWTEAWRALWRRWIERRLDAVRRVWWKFVPPKMPEAKG
jgi:transglutaminase-like putative cysteine protease